MVEVKFHDIGEGMNEGEILNYFVKVGDTVAVDQPLVELQTDKMVAEIPSPAAGEINAIHFETGKVVTVGTVILEIKNGNEKGLNKKAQITSKNQPMKRRILAAPFTRKIARENNVNIEQINGSGPAGRVTDEDVYRLIKNASTVNHDISPHKVQVESKNEQTNEVDTIPFTGIRKQIAKKMTESLTTIPHVTHFDEADLTNVLAFRKALKQAGENISVVAFFLKALAISLKEYPIFNAQLEEENNLIRLHKQYHIGLATNTDRGLLVPVLHHVDKKTIREINKEMKVLTKKAQDGSLSAKEMQQGTFTMSNVGPLGGTGATPIINHPQTAIIAFHKTKKTPVVTENEEITIRSIMTLSLSFDHRVADGAESVAFTNRFIELMEEPQKLVLELI